LFDYIILNFVSGFRHNLSPIYSIYQKLKNP
jgi:hypothetical protein